MPLLINPEGEICCSAARTLLWVAMVSAATVTWPQLQQLPAQQGLASREPGAAEALAAYLQPFQSDIQPGGPGFNCRAWRGPRRAKVLV